MFVTVPSFFRGGAVFLWSAVASAARHRFGLCGGSPVDGTIWPLIQSAVAASLCRRTPNGDFHERRHQTKRVRTGSGSDRVESGHPTSQLSPHLHRRSTARRARTVSRNRSEPNPQLRELARRESAGARLRHQRPVWRSRRFNPTCAKACRACGANGSSRVAM